MKVRVVVFATAPGDDPGAVERAYHQVSRDLAGTPGLCGNELLRSVTDGSDFAVVSEWEDLAAFQAWEAGVRHKDTTAPLRPFQRPRSSTFGIYQVTAAY
jgi:heme-degrading monooxygenase HmoA